VHQDDAVIPDTVEISAPREESHAEPAGGTSLRDRIDAAETSDAAPPADSIDAIRDEAMRALEEARSLKDAPLVDADAEPASPEPVSRESRSAAPILDYSPSVPAPVRTTDEDEHEDEEEEEEEMVQSRYSRNSAKLPRLGIEPGAASSTIADLRKQMTADS